MKDGKPVLITDFIPDTGSVTADQFVEWLIPGEGVDLNKVGSSQLKRWRREVEGSLREAYGAEVADAARSFDERPGHLAFTDEPVMTLSRHGAQGFAAGS